MTQNPQPNNRLTLTPDELEKVAKRRKLSENAKVDEDWMFIAEFGYYFGWQGVEAVMLNKVDYDTAALLLISARKVWAGKVYDQAQASFIGAASANSKKPSVVFKKLTSDLLKFSKADKL